MSLLPIIPILLRGIIPAELLELGCPKENQCSGGTARNRMAPCRGFCDNGTTAGTCTGSADLCGADPDDFNCNHCCECPDEASEDVKASTDTTKASEDVKVEYRFEE
eukprot:298369_1